MNQGFHELLMVPHFQNSLTFPGFGYWYIERQRVCKREGETAERGKMSAQWDSPPQLTAQTSPLSLARLSGLSGGSCLKVDPDRRLHHNGLVSSRHLPLLSQLHLLALCWFIFHKNTIQYQRISMVWTKTQLGSNIWYRM